MIVGFNGRYLGAILTGVQRFARELLPRASAACDVVLLVPRDGKVPDRFHGTVVRGRLRGHAWEQIELPDAARAAGCDVVLHPANTAPWRAHRSVVVVHDPLFPLSNPEWFTRRYAFWQKHAIAPALRRASRILTVSEWSRARLATELGVGPDRIGVVPQGLAPFDAPASADEIDRVRRTYGLPERYLIAFGGRDPRKNIRFLLGVADELACRRPDLPILVVGDAHPRVHPPDARVVERPNLKLLGQLGPADTHPLLTGAGALCFPSLAEGFGRPPLEALACGTPAIVGPYEAACEVLGDAGRIVDWDPAAWVDALEAALDDSGARVCAREQGEALSRRFNWERATEVTLEACERVARSPAYALA